MLYSIIRIKVNLIVRNPPDQDAIYSGDIIGLIYYAGRKATD